MIKLSVGYPTVEDELEILRRRRERKMDAFNLEAVTDAGGLLAMRQVVEEVFIDPDIERYIVDLVNRTRHHNQVAVGSSPRGALALLKLTRARSAMQGREYVLPDDVKSFLRPALSHRLILEPELWSVRKATEKMIDEIASSVPVPVIQDMK
jgi:MoxR-like ATPase